MSWNTSDIPDQTGRTFLITGANSGLGEQTALAVGAAGAQVILACRNVAKAEPVAARIGSGATISELDLANLDSVRAFAERTGPVDVLINNAGVMAVPQRRTADGFEMQFGTNHLGHFALTGLLLPKVSDRVVTLSSSMHQIGKINLEDPNYRQRRYLRWPAYGQSKLANLLFGYELARRLAAIGSPVKSIVAHPGYAATELQSHTESIWDRLMALGGGYVAQPAADGALPQLYAATSPQARSGGFYGPTQLGGMRGAPGPAKSNKRSHDELMAAGLWDLSVSLTGVEYSFEPVSR
jgi:NAD(P)-dependent dehydrogenase (short-subunit alcohol dehydrogenase family)